LEELLVTSANTSDLRTVVEAARKDQWKLGKRHLVLEELRLKVEIGVLSKEQAVAELVRLPELARTKWRSQRISRCTSGGRMCRSGWLRNGGRKGRVQRRKWKRRGRP